MSRSLLGFLTFCLLLVLVSAGVVWYVGPTLAGIVADDEYRDNPYYLLQLLPRAAVTADGASSYRSRFVTLAGEEDGRLLWQGGTVDVAEGSVLLDVAAAQLLAFPRGVDLVQMLTSSAYRALDSAATDLAVQHLGASSAPGDMPADRATMVVLYRAEPSVSAPLGVPGESGWVSLVPRYQGTVLWDAAVAVIHGEQPWNRVLLLQFPDTSAAYGWLEDPLTVTERAIAGKRVEELTALVIQPAAAPR